MFSFLCVLSFQCVFSFLCAFNFLCVPVLFRKVKKKSPPKYLRHLCSEALCNKGINILQTLNSLKNLFTYNYN